MISMRFLLLLALLVGCDSPPRFHGSSYYEEEEANSRRKAAVLERMRQGDVAGTLAAYSSLCPTLRRESVLAFFSVPCAHAAFSIECEGLLFDANDRFPAVCEVIPGSQFLGP